MATRLPRGTTNMGIGAEGPNRFMACHSRGPTIACHLNELLINNGLGLGCPVTTVLCRRMCMGGGCRTSCSEAKRSYAGPVRLNLSVIPF